MNLRITGITALKQYRELVSAIWCCPIDEVEQSDITHESSIKEREITLGDEGRLQSVSGSATRRAKNKECVVLVG